MSLKSGDISSDKSTKHFLQGFAMREITPREKIFAAQEVATHSATNAVPYWSCPWSSNHPSYRISSTYPCQSYSRGKNQ